MSLTRVKGHLSSTGSSTRSSTRASSRDAPGSWLGGTSPLRAAREPFLSALAEARPLLFQRALRYGLQDAAAHDLVQDTLERALTQRHLFISGSVVAWTMRIMRNLFIDECRRSVRFAEADWETLESPEPTPDPMNEIIDLLEMEDVRRQLASFRPQDRELFELAYFACWDRREIAKRMGLRLATAGTRLFRIKAKLRQELANLMAGRREGRAAKVAPWRSSFTPPPLESSGPGAAFMKASAGTKRAPSLGPTVEP